MADRSVFIRPSSASIIASPGPNEPIPPLPSLARSAPRTRCWRIERAKSLDSSGTLVYRALA